MPKIYLRAIEPDDAKITYKWRNDRAVTDPLGGNSYFVSEAKEMAWIQKVIQNDSSSVRLGICSIDNNTLIGFVNLIRINYQNQNAEFSIMIGDGDYRGKGFGFEATIMCLMYAFDELNMNRIYLYVRQDNPIAIALYTKIGFVEEGVLRQAIYKNGEWVNMAVMSILKNEFSEKNRNIHF